ncbi:hypothetical protein P154DRAFT_447493, partial [Amniculicola lignicola CBS 123094]
KEFLNKFCLDSIHLELIFPLCWNRRGLNLYNHKAYIAYPNLVNKGVYPIEYLTRIPALYYKTI